MKGTTSIIVLWSMKADQVALDLATTEAAMYSDVRVKTQFAANIHPVSATVRLEYWIVTVSAWTWTSVMLGPSSALYVNRFAPSALVECMAKPLGGSTLENCAISTDSLVAGFMACADTWKV